VTTSGVSSVAACYVCQLPSVVVRKGANRDYGLCARHVERAALNEAWQAVDQAVRPLGHYGGASNSPWNKGYEQAKNEALNAILGLREALDARPRQPLDRDRSVETT
jgi:hypothetical protein